VSREETSEEMDEETGNGVGEKPAGPPPPPLPEFNGKFLGSYYLPQVIRISVSSVFR